MQTLQHAPRAARLLASLLLALLAPGCQRGPQLCLVTGTVTYQGKVVEQGQIVFADVDRHTPTAATQIEHGVYQLKIRPGDKQVRITANKETGRMLKGAMGVELPERVDIIPPQYNTATTLLRTIAPQDNMVLDFALD